MLAKHWKKIGLIILVVACVFNIMSKMVNKMSLDKELITSATYVRDEQKNNNTWINKKNMLLYNTVNLR